MFGALIMVFNVRYKSSKPLTFKNSNASFDCHVAFSLFVEAGRIGNVQEEACYLHWDRLLDLDWKHF